MTDSIETFIERLHREGVQTGRQQSQQIIEDAQSQAKKILADADSQARQIVADANKLASQSLENAKTDLRLAARDCVLKLRQTISGILTRVLCETTKEKMSDPNFVGDLIKHIVLANSSGGVPQRLEFNVTPEVKSKLTHQAIELAKSASKTVDIRAEMKSAGFEYGIDKGVCEVTPQTIVETMSQMVNDELRSLISNAHGTVQS